MKTQTCRRLLRRITALIALAPLASLAAETTAPAEDQKSSAESYVLFTGTDIQIQHEGTLHSVCGVESEAFLIQMNDRKVSIPMRTNSEKLKVSRVQLLANRLASVANFKYERIYTPASDPHRKFVKEMQGLSAATESASMLAGIRDKLPLQEEAGQGSFQPNRYYVNAAANAQTAATSVSGDMGSSAAYSQRLADELALGLFDALDVQFELSSAKPIQNPYVVVMATYREKDDTKHVRKWLFAKALPPIDDQPSKISLHEAGFPQGFTVENLRVHLYENGVEIATDLSENRALLTREEAHEYLVIDYTSTHKDSTHSPRLALASLPEDWAVHRNEESFRKTYYVKVDKTGRASGVFEDENCTKTAADSYCAGVLNSLLFFPALEKGKPVDGVIRIKPTGVAHQLRNDIRS